MEKAQSENLACPMRNGRTFSYAMEMFAGIHLPNVVWNICVCVIRDIQRLERPSTYWKGRTNEPLVTPRNAGRARGGDCAEEHSLFCRICWKNTFDLLTNSRFCAMIRNGLRDRNIWAHSSAGRAPRSQCGGQGFDPPWVHQRSTAILIQWVSRLRCFLFAQKP